MKGETVNFKEAKRLSILKWEWFSKHGRLKRETDLKDYGDRMRRNVPEVDSLICCCGFCEFYSMNCSRCALTKKWGSSCLTHKTIFHKWTKCRNNKKSKALAKQILADIKECEE